MLLTITTLCYTQLPLYATHNYHFMLHTINTLCYTQCQMTAGLKLVQFQCALPSGEHKMVEYKCVLWYYFSKCLLG